MLVLSRKSQEVIYVGDSIKIFVVEILADKVRIGVEAPKNVPIHRSEVYHNIKEKERNSN